MGKFIDLTDQKFGKWTVIKRLENDPRGQTKWYCKCDCGKEKIVLGNKLRHGESKSCGCNWKTQCRTHGMWNTTEYISYYSMIQRCNNKNNTSYYKYGGIGITVCERWMKFENFIEDMGLKPTPLHSIDRINGNGIYEPNNCRWSDKKVQSWNTKIRSENVSGVKGVSWDNKNKKWRATIHVNGRQINLGRFDTIEEASIVRKNSELKFQPLSQN